MSALSDRARIALLVAVLALVLVAGCALSAYSAPDAGRSDTGRVLGKTGFAFIGGLRTFAAAVIWNRIDPIMHEYYGGRDLVEMRYMLPHLRLVTALDPQFVQAYYVASYMVARGVGMDQGLAIAREGLRNNPTSGLLCANLAQLLSFDDKRANLTEMKALADRGMRADMHWANDDDRYDALVMFRSVYQLSGDATKVAVISHELESIKAGGELSDHDHNGDGRPDH